MRVIHLCFGRNVPLNDALVGAGFRLTRVDFAVPWRAKLLAALSREPNPDALVASWQGEMGIIGLSNEPGCFLNPADDEDSGSLVRWLRRQPDSWLMDDGRRWNAVPFVVIHPRSFDEAFTDLTDDPIYLTWRIGGDGRGAQEAALDLRQVIDGYWRRVLDELDQCGFVIRYHEGRLVATAAYNVQPGANPPLVYHSGKATNGTPHVLTVRPGALDPSSDFVVFEQLISNPRVTERELQRFLEKHPRFLSEGGTLQPQAHPRLVERTGRLLIPDFLLRPNLKHVLDNRWKVVDLKLPSTQLLVGSRRRRRLSAEIHHAIRQLLDYGEYFSNPANAASVNAAIGYSLRFPRLAVLVGRMPDGDDARALSSEQSRHPEVALVTYDELLDEQRPF